MQPGAIVLQAGQDGKIALIGKLAAELLDVVNAILLVLVGASVLGKGFGRQAREQREGQEILVHLRFLLFWQSAARCRFRRYFAGTSRDLLASAFPSQTRTLR
jgi:hypothetical protein